MTEEKSKDVEYKIYGILYEDFMGKTSTATISAESGKEAIDILKETLKDKGYVEPRYIPIAKDTGVRTSEKKLIFGYDSYSESLLR